MHVAIGYRWFPTAAGYHFERVFASSDHKVTFVGLGGGARAGYGGAAPIDSILEAMPERPNLFLWIDPAGPYFPAGIERLPIPTVCYLIDVHLGEWRQSVANYFDLVFIAQKDSVAAYQSALGHSQVFWLPLAAAPDIHKDHNLLRSYDVGFVGNVLREHRRSGRVRRLELLRSRYRMNDPYRHYPPAEVGTVYSQSKIVFNTSIAGDVTMRLFEGTAAGALVVTDATANGLDELFVPGKEIVTYGDDADLLEKVGYYLAHEEERAAIAAAGQRRTLAEHTYAHRGKTIVERALCLPSGHQAPMRSASESAQAAARRDVYTHLQMLDALLEAERAAGHAPPVRLWHALPCLVRRLLL